MGLSYTFLGTDNKSDNEVYTPLIIPNSTYGLNSDINTDTDSLATPFSRIRNYLKNNLDNPSNVTIQTINVLHDYMWTISPKTSKSGRDASEYSNENFRNVNDETPYIFLKEKYFLINNLIAQALYSLSTLDGVSGVEALKSFIGEGAAEAPNVFRRLANNVQKGGDATAEFVTKLTNDNQIEGPVEPSGIAKAASATGNAISGAIKSFSNNIDALQAIFRKFNNPDLESVLFPYQKLYFVGSTGFQYKIPYLNY